MQAMQAMTRAGRRWLAGADCGVLITVNALGGVGGWFAATARLPFVAGLDRFLPRAFGRCTRGGERRTSRCSCRRRSRRCSSCSARPARSVRGAYDVLVSMSIITYFIPFLFMFAAMIRLQREPAGAGVIRVPGGRAGRDAARRARVRRRPRSSIVLACVPAADEPNKTLAVVKDRRLVGGAALRRRGRVCDAEADGRRKPRYESSASASWRPCRCRVAAAPPPTMRVDYYHTGNDKEERFSLDRVVVEPLPWPGNPAQADRRDQSRQVFLRGRRRRERAGRCTRAASARFTASGRRPPKRKTIEPDVLGIVAISRASTSRSRIVVKKRDAKNAFREIWTFDGRSRRQVHRARRRRRRAGALIKLHEAAIPAKKLDLLILGDGYTAARARQIRARCAAAGASAVRDVAVQGAAARHQRVGTRAAGGAVGRLTAVATHLPAHRRSAPCTTRSIPSATS